MVDRDNILKKRSRAAVAVFAAVMMLAASFVFIATQPVDDSQDVPLGAAAPQILDFDDITITDGARADTHRITWVDPSVSGAITLVGIENAGVSMIIDSIGPEAFKGCDQITSIELGEELVAIGPNAFEGCTALTSITFAPPAGLLSYHLDDDMFTGCSSLTTIVIDVEDVTEDLMDWDMLFGQARTAGPDELGIVFTDKVRTVADGAFEGISSITAITFGANIESVGDNAFYGCSSLNLLRLPPMGAGTDVTIDIGANVVSRNVSINYMYTGYTKDFFGWFDGPNYMEDNPVKFIPKDNEAFTLYGLWALGYKVSFMDCIDDVLTEILSYDVPAGYEFEIDSHEAFVKEGYYVAGWLCDYDDKEYAEGNAFLMPDADVQFLVIWELTPPEKDDSLMFAVIFFILMLALLFAFLLFVKTSKKR